MHVAAAMTGGGGRLEPFPVSAEPLRRGPVDLDGHGKRAG